MLRFITQTLIKSTLGRAILSYCGRRAAISAHRSGSVRRADCSVTEHDPPPLIGVWASISLRRDGTLVPMDRGGHPTINPFINPDGEKNLYNTRQPADDVANYLGPWSKILGNGGYLPEAAKAAALEVLPDILRYDRTQPATYPNGRITTDDVYSARFAWLSNGKIPSAGLKPHDDLLAQFPTSARPIPNRRYRD